MDRFKEVWCCDFEFSAPDGENPRVACMVAREFRTGRLIRLGADELSDLSEAPFDTGPDSLFVAYYASAELNSFLSLGWTMPRKVLDLYVEFRAATNGLDVPDNGLLHALTYYGIESISLGEKQEMRALAMRGGPWTSDEMVALLDYCQTDVDALMKLLPAMMLRLDLGPALLRGRYMRAAAHIETAGIPIDVEMLGRFRDNWSDIQEGLIRDLDTKFGVFEGRTFKASRWAAWLVRNGIAWPHLESGELDLRDDTFQEMSTAHPDIALMKDLRYSLSRMRLHELPVGSDGRNRTLLSAFKARTGRNAPSTSRFIFGPSTWMRGLIKPGPGKALAYVDWSQQEIGIAAILSGDRAMLDAYTSGDPYIAFGKQSGLIPPSGTKQTHPTERELCKQCVLGVGYGMGDYTLSRRIGKSPAHARRLLRHHKDTYPAFWKWSDSAESHGMILGHIRTVFGWPIWTTLESKQRSLRNFPCQANGAEMLRLACCYATEAGIKLIAPVHDALMVEADVDEIDAVVAATQEHMARASADVLGGFRLGSDAKVICSPDRYMDGRGLGFWNKVVGLLPPKGCPGDCTY